MTSATTSTSATHLPLSDSNSAHSSPIANNSRRQKVKGSKASRISDGRTKIIRNSEKLSIQDQEKNRPNTASVNGKESKILNDEQVEKLMTFLGRYN